MGVTPVVSALLTVLLAASGPSGIADRQAVQRVVGHYELTVGYTHEPPELEVGNSLDVAVRDTRSGTPVVGLERSLGIEGMVTVETLTRRFPVVLRAARDRPGVYEGVFVPPAIGEYRFRLTGVIDSVPVDETFQSGAGGLPDVEVAERSFTAPGVLIAVGIVIAYLLAMAGLLVWRWRRPRRRAAGAGEGP